MHKIVFIINLAMLILSILLFGGVHTYAYTLMSLGLLCSGFLWTWGNIYRDQQNGRLFYRFPATPFNFLFFTILLLLFFQITPLPFAVLQILAPHTADLLQKAFYPPLVADELAKQWAAVATYGHPVRLSIIRWTAYGMFWMGLVQVLNSKQRIALAIALILMVCCFDALYGMIQTFSGAERIWWFEKEAYRKSVTGTYINRNHFAGLMELGLLLAAAYAAALLNRRKRGRSESWKSKKARVRLANLLSGNHQFYQLVLVTFAGAILGMGLVFSASRGGLIAAAMGLFFMGMLFLLRRGLRRNGAVILVILLTVSIYALNIGIEYTLSRFDDIDASFEKRARFSRQTMAIFQTYQPCGIGVGNFQYIYPKWQDATIVNQRLLYAHNDWIQFLAEAGVPGAFLLILGIGYFFFSAFRLWLRRRDPMAVCLGTASLAAMIAIGVHSYVDFNLHITANFLMLTAVIAIGHGALSMSGSNRSHKYVRRYHTYPLKYKGAMLLLALNGLIFLNLTWAIRHFMAEHYCKSVPNSTMNLNLLPSSTQIRQAIVWDSSNSAYHFKLAYEQLRIRDGVMNVLGTLRTSKAETTHAIIVMALRRAIRLNPSEARQHLKLGFEFAFNAKKQSTERCYDAADLAMERAGYFAGPINPELHLLLGNYYVRRSVMFGAASPKHRTMLVKAAKYYHLALIGSNSKNMKAKIRAYVHKFYGNQEVFQKFIGENE